MANGLQRVEISVDGRPIVVSERKPGDFGHDLQLTQKALQAQFGATAMELANRVHTENRRDLTDPE